MHGKTAANLGDGSAMVRGFAVVFVIATNTAPATATAIPLSFENDRNKGFASSSIVLDGIMVPFLD